MTQYDLRSKMFEYLKDGMENDIWEGRTTIRISSLSKHIVSIVDNKYNVKSKTKTLSSLLYIGCFRLLDSIDNTNWNKFVDSSSMLDMDSLSLCDRIGTQEHREYYKTKFSLHSIGYQWVDSLNSIWPVVDKKQIYHHMLNDHRTGNVFDMFTDRFGFSVKEAANMFILYSINNSDVMYGHNNTIQHLQRIDRLINQTTIDINDGIKTYNDVYYKQ